MGNIRKRGKSWTAQVRLKGWQNFTKSFSTKNDALNWIRTTENKLKNKPKPISSKASLTLADLLEEYAQKVTVNLKGFEKELYKISLYRRHPIAQNKVVYLTQHHFECLRDERLKQVRSGTVHADLMLFKRVFKRAIKNWHYSIISNPVENIEMPKPHKSRKRRLLGNEKEQILNAAKAQRNDYICLVIEFAIETGMRRSEILKLKWHDINLETGFASLYDTKNGEDRKVPLTKRCIEVLNQLPRSHEHVFHISATCLHQAWQRAVKKAEIRDLRFHDLRHEAVSRFFEMGMSVPEVALISGHKDVTQLFRYTHLNPENVFAKYTAFMKSEV